MRKALLILNFTLFTFHFSLAQDYPIQPVPFTAVKVSSQFWAPRLETNRTVTIPFAFKKCEETGRIDNFAIAGNLKKGQFRGIRYDDSDVFKVIEGAAYSLASRPDPNSTLTLTTSSPKSPPPRNPTATSTPSAPSRATASAT